VDFYVLPDTTGEARLAFACRIAEKAYSQAHRVYLHASSAAEAERLDALLWTFRDTSFVPHALAGTALPAANLPPVLIGHENGHADDFLAAEPGTLISPGEIRNVPISPISVLINLSEDVPGFHDRFARVAEVVDADAGRRHRSRERFKAYRAHGCLLETHRLPAHG
jgi:DNA polymerase-3 subunit chi